MSDQDPVTLVIGYSFGVSPTSEPGRLNNRIAEYIAGDFKSLQGRTFVAVQWELDDALQTIHKSPPRDFVVAPAPLFREDAIDEALLGRLKSEVESHALLRESFAEINLHPNLREVFAYPNRLASYLNYFIMKRDVFRDFSSLTIRDFIKRKNNRDWIEWRQIPPASCGELAQYQAQRVNRLILQELLPDLPKASYVGTVDVADAVMKEICHRRLRIKDVRVYGHPEHVSRCMKQTLESAWKYGLNVDRTQLHEIKCGNKDQQDADENWDPENAQEWIQSWTNWAAHENI
jgi:hypothetical protein